MSEFNSENGRIHLFNMDCMEYMAQFPDNYFELAIVDPPYGIGISGNPVRRAHEKKQWDSTAPNDSYFTQLKRVSKNQIIWGANYFNLPPTPCFVVWDKEQPEQFSMAMVEFAWTSFKNPAKLFRKRVVSADVERIHPTQKPVKLYEWLLKNYAKDGDKILDTHLGSASSAIAAHRMGFEFFGTELDGDYFQASIARFERETAQLDMFAQETE